jgi:methylthioribose-1-phosphate isomerase
MPSVTEPDAVCGLQTLIEERQGFRLSRAVEGVKVALSSVEETVLAFDVGPAQIRRPISRA